MKGLITKDLLTIKKKYGYNRILMDIAIIISLMFILEDAGAIYISFLLLPIEITSIIISLSNCDEQWKWGKYAISLPVTKTQIVRSRYIFATILSFLGLSISLLVNTISFFSFHNYKFGFYLFIAGAAFAVILLFLAIILPSNYSLGVNAGFAVMLVLIILLLVLGFWSKMTDNAIMVFVVNNFELCLGIALITIIFLYMFSYYLSVYFFKKKYI